MCKIVTLGLMMTIFTVQQSSAEITLPVPAQNNEINESGYINVPSSQQKDSSKDDSHLLKKPSEASTSYSEGYTKLPSPPSTKIPQIAPKVEIKMRAGANEGKILLDPMVAELSNFIDAGGVANNLLTRDGIFKILQAGGKIKRDFVNVENLSNTITLGNTVQMPFGKVTRFETGFFSDQIYKITLNPAVAVDASQTAFIIKSVKSAWGPKVKSRKQETPIKEIQNLKRVEQIILPEAIQLKHKNPDFPILAVPDKTFYYFDKNHLKQYVAIIPLSSGKSVQDFMKAYLLQDDVQGLDAVMKKVGKALGEFHYNLATVEAQEKLSAGLLSYADFKTVIHGDFHRGNVFLDQNKVTLIDNATIGDSIITPKSPISDIYRFYGFTYIDGLWGLNPKQFHQVDNSFMSFIDGYISAFPLSIQNSITEFLHTTFAKIHEEIKQQFEGYLTNKINDIPPITTNDQNLKWFMNFILGNLKHYVAKGGGKSQMAEKLFQIPAGKSAILIQDNGKSSTSGPVGFYVD